MVISMIKTKPFSLLFMTMGLSLRMVKRGYR